MKKLQDRISNLNAKEFFHFNFYQLSKGLSATLFKFCVIHSIFTLRVLFVYTTEGLRERRIFHVCSIAAVSELRTIITTTSYYYFYFHYRVSQ
jgi:hypothetical protein